MSAAAIALIVLLVLAVAVMLIALGVFKSQLMRRKKKKSKHRAHKYDALADKIREGALWLDAQNTEKLEIKSADGLKLRARLLRGGEDLVILLHGHHSGSYARAFDAKWYHEMGFSVLLPDHRTHGESEGRYITLGWFESRDVLRWAELMRQMFTGRLFLDGTSMGGATALMAAAERPERLAGVVSDCAFASVPEVIDYKAHKWCPPLAFAQRLLWVYARIFARFSMPKASAVAAAKKICVPTLLIHGEADDFVPPYMAKEIFDSCGAEEKHLLLIPGAVHGTARIVAPERTHEAIIKYILKI